jgi:Glycosyltransferase
MDWRSYGLALSLVVKACALLSRWPDVVTANSAAGLKSHLALGYHPRRTQVLANGIDVDHFRPDAAARVAVRTELGIPENAMVVAHVARVDAMKDHGSFLAAMTALPDVFALLVGAGTEDLAAAPNLFASAATAMWRACLPPRMLSCRVRAGAKDSPTFWRKEWLAVCRLLPPTSAMRGSSLPTRGSWCRRKAPRRSRRRSGHWRPNQRPCGRNAGGGRGSALSRIFR